MTLSSSGTLIVRRSLLLAPLQWALPARAQPAIPPGLRDQAAGLLTALIRSGRELAIAAGVQPVPPAMQRRLRGFFPDALLRKVRHATGDAEPMAIPGLALSYGHIDAITLIDVIVFRDPHAAGDDAKLWAHELTHVMQYERWGVEGFAARYLADNEAVEQEARDNADRFVRWRGPG